MTGGSWRGGDAAGALVGGLHGDGWPPARTQMTVSTERGHLAFVTTPARAGLYRGGPGRWGGPGDWGGSVHDLRGQARRRLAGRRGCIKGTLLGESVVAGLGNWLVDEVLHAAGVDPRRRSASLTPSEVTRLRTAIEEVVGFAVGVEADAGRFPETWLFHLRWGAPVATTRDGASLEFITVAGRRTLVVPGRQR